MNFNPISALVNTVAGVVTGIGKTFFGSRQERDSQNHQVNMAVYNQYAAEFGHRENRTWWDSLVDALNRLPRPVLVGLMIAYFLLSYINPIEFQKVNVALDTVPESMWYVLGVIIGFYFAARELHKNRDEKMALSDQQFGEVLRRQQALDALKPTMSEAEFQAEMSDTSKPTSNAALAEWNRRHDQR
tara:strand:- start:2301 stop:2861 length:561 start_codon:yes stop_codon:yes gene_type:complete